MSARMLDGQNIKIAMTLLPPGATGEPVKVETVAAISSDDKVDLRSRTRGSGTFYGHFPGSAAVFHKRLLRFRC